MIECLKIMHTLNLKIGNLPLENAVILAPMAGVSDLPYRIINKRFGAGLVYSEMVSANGLIRNGKRTLELVRSKAEERPLAVQLFGDDPEVMARAAEIISEYADLLDINMGCPVKKVVRSGAGSALLREPALIGRMVAAVRKASPLPLSVKIRSGWDSSSINYLEVGRIIEAEGADAVTLHGRTRAQGFSGHSDWSHLAALKQALGVPVIGSGDIFSVEDALAMKEQSGCDALMIGRGGYGNPWLVRDLVDRLSGLPQRPEPTPQEILQVALDHLDLAIASFAPAKALADMRKHLCWYSRGCSGAASLRSSLNAATDLENLRADIIHFFDDISD